MKITKLVVVVVVVVVVIVVVVVLVVVVAAEGVQKNTKVTCHTSAKQ